MFETIIIIITAYLIVFFNKYFLINVCVYTYIYINSVKDILKISGGRISFRSSRRENCTLECKSSNNQPSITRIRIVKQNEKCAINTV